MNDQTVTTTARTGREKNNITPCQKAVMSIEGILIIIYSLGLFFLSTGLQFENRILETLRAMLVMLLIPLVIPLFPLFIYSTVILIYYRFTKGKLERNQQRVFFIHLIYEAFFIFFIVSWMLKSGQR